MAVNQSKRAVRPINAWLAQLWDEQGITQPVARHLSWPMNISFQLAVEELVPPSQRNRFAVNLGAADGRKLDPTYPLFAAGWKGVAVEGFEKVRSELHANLAQVNSSVRPQPLKLVLFLVSVDPECLPMAAGRRPRAVGLLRAGHHR